MQFKDIIGQSLLKKELPELMKDNRLAHALLFLSKEGNGGLQLALALAQYVVCEKVNKQWAISNGQIPIGNKQQANQPLFGDEPTPSPLATPHSLTDSCGICPSCIKAQQLVHTRYSFFLSCCYQEIRNAADQR
ncbi:MAG: hypothetical protein WDN26_07570 [Chitinophagaceae bacterium]